MPAIVAAHAASGATLPADALGFPQSGREAREAAAGQPVLELSSADAATLGDEGGVAAFGGYCSLVNPRSPGGFEDLPTVLVANLIVSFLGSTGLATIRHLATLYPDFRDAIRHAVDADPEYQSLATLLPPMRVIALRDLLWAAPARAGANKMTQRQYSQASDALDEDRWLPFVEQLVGNKVDGVRPEHDALLAVCDSLLRGDKLEQAAVTETPRLANVIKLNAKQCQQLMSLVWLKQHGQGMRDLDFDISWFRKDVLRDAFARIANAFAAEEGWTVEGLTSAG
ncbi:MAG: hypothetical protein H7332_09085 [Bdellovibrionales bacterium]|nr:hypothetical protein [Ramlibacter sp.]